MGWTRLGTWVALVLLGAASCGDDDAEPGGDGGAGAGGAPDSDPSLGGASGEAGAPSSSGDGGRSTGEAGMPPILAGFGGTANASASGAGGLDASGGAGGGAGDAGGASCELGPMPVSPLSPSDSACSGSCMVPPLDGKPRGGACAELGTTPPASANVDPGDNLVAPPTAPPGLPCDDGWCAGNVATNVEKVGTIRTTDNRELHAVQASGTDTYYWLSAKRFNGVSYVSNAPGEADDAFVDGDEWSEPQLGGVNVTGYVTPPFLLAVDSRPASPRRYASYGGVRQNDVLVQGPRFGEMLEGTWVFTDVPTGWTPIEEIQVDTNGDALVLRAGAIYRHTSGGSFESVALPCALHADSFATDPVSGTWYVLDYEAQRLYRRDDTGIWTTEALPFALRTKPVYPEGRVALERSKVFIAGGTVHITAAEGVTHRQGSSWSTPIWPTLTGNGIAQEPVAVAIDSCWAPHLAYGLLYNETGYYSLRMYARWTARGFLRTNLVGSSLTFANPVATTTSTKAILVSQDYLSLVPRK